MDPSLGMQQAAKGLKVGYGPKSYDTKLGKMWKTTGKKKKKKVGAVGPSLETRSWEKFVFTVKEKIHPIHQKIKLVAPPV